MDGNNTVSSGDGFKKCSCPHHKVVPICIIIVGLLLIIGAWVPMMNMMVWEIIFGVLLVIIGGMKVMKGKCKCC